MAAEGDNEGAAATSEEEKPEQRSADSEQSGDQADASESQPEDQQEDGDSSKKAASVAHAIDDVSSLPGETVNDQDGRKVGEVKEIYGVGDDDTPMWVTIESSTGLGRSRHLFVPLARIKRQHDEIRIPYSFDHLHDAPEVEPGDELSEEDDRALRAYYSIGLADQEMVDNPQSYASQVPDEDEPARKIDASSAEGPVREIEDAPPAERAAEAYEKQREEQGDEEHRSGRKATADELFEEDGSGGGKSEDGESEDEKSEDEPRAQGERSDEQGEKASGDDDAKREEPKDSDGEAG